MNIGDFLDLAREGITVLLFTVGPLMLISLTVGLGIALFQALTQIQEMTLAFVPKILVVFTSLLIFLPFMISTLITFTEGLAQRIIGIG